MLLAGDVGGTKTLLGLFEGDGARPAPVVIEEFATGDHAGLEPLLRVFLARHLEGSTPVSSAAFGVAGPVIDQVAALTNGTWVVDGRSIGSGLGIRRVTVLNDLEAMAHAVPVLEARELHVLQAGQPRPSGNAALLAAGTGLGEAVLIRVGRELVPSPTEGGHADWAPRTPREVDVLRTLSAEFGRVDVEHVVSGPGLVNLSRVTHRGGGSCAAAAAAGSGDAAAISASARTRACARCVEALDLFVAAYGAEAGNLALRSMATSGVYVGGGIAPKILWALEPGGFIEAFRAKAPMDTLMSSIPVSVILNRQVGLLGAAVAAARG